MIPLVLEIVVTFFCVCHGELDSLHQNNLKKINIQTSKDILLYILDEVEKITITQNASSLECEANINQTMLSCTRCEKNRCQSTQPQIHEQMIDGLLYEVNKPITKAAKFGQNVGKLVNKLDRKLHSWSEDITWKFNGWLKQAEKQANKVKNGIVDTGKQIGKGAENAGKKVWGGIKSIFGKRSTRHMKKRCAKSCPQCDRLNTNTNKQSKAILSSKWNKIYNSTLTFIPLSKRLR
ncbi:uncharacterized protein [Mytilus edulis]|uniref:uncharacterized protein n=1 Tax=Mytilus edulis TaxID=6550 RepID=UPI0039F0B098